MNFIARVISVLFHPLLMVTYLFSLFALVFPYGLDPLKEEGQWTFIFVLFLGTFLFPSLIISLFRSMGFVKSITMEDRKERIFPFVLITLLYISFTYMFYQRTGVSVRDNLFKFIVITDGLLVVATLVTLFYKVSVHSLAAWGFIGILLPLNHVAEDGSLFYPLIASIVVAGLVMSARLQLHAHTSREVMTGAILGLVTGFTGMIVLF